MTPLDGNESGGDMVSDLGPTGVVPPGGNARG